MWFEVNATNLTLSIWRITFLMLFFCLKSTWNRRNVPRKIVKSNKTNILNCLLFFFFFFFGGIIIPDSISHIMFQYPRGPHCHDLFISDPHLIWRVIQFWQEAIDSNYQQKRRIKITSDQTKVMRFLFQHMRSLKVYTQ